MLHKAKACISLLAIVLSSVMGCTEPEQSNPNFPQLRGGPVGLEADLDGELVSENGCLRLRQLRGPSYLIIWPHMSMMTSDGQGVRLSKDSEVLLSVGDRVIVSGGETPPDHAHEVVAQSIPSDCPGPYWLLGREVSIYSNEGPDAPAGENPIPAGASQQTST